MPRKIAAAPETTVDTCTTDIIWSVAEATHSPAEARADDREAAAKWKRIYQPEPFNSRIVLLSAGRDEPKMHLYRDNQMGEFAIAFDEKPESHHRKAVWDAGFAGSRPP